MFQFRRLFGALMAIVVAAIVWQFRTELPPGPLSTMRYEGCADGAEVRLIRIDGLGHRWTREEVDTTVVMWQFFKQHQLRR